MRLKCRRQMSRSRGMKRSIHKIDRQIDRQDIKIPVNLDSQDKVPIQQMQRTSGQAEKKQSNIVRIIMIGVMLIVVLVLVSIYAPIYEQENNLKPSDVEVDTQEDDVYDQKLEIKEKDKEINIQKAREKQSFQESVVKVQVKPSLQTFQPILWVQSLTELTGRSMKEQLVAQNLIHFAKKSNFTIRIVSNQNAYDWLSPQMEKRIHTTYHNSKIQVNVYELIRIALLIEHGGIHFRLGSVMALQDFSWVEKLFTMQTQENELCDQKKQKQVFMFIERSEKGIQFNDMMIVAKKSSTMLRQIFDEICQILQSGIWPYKSFSIQSIVKETNSTELPNIFNALVKIKFEQDKQKFCKTYHLASVDLKHPKYIMSIQPKDLLNVMNLKISDFHKKFGIKYLAYFKFNSQMIETTVKMIKTGYSEEGDTSILKNKMMLADGNKWLAQVPNRNRRVELCVVSLIPDATLDFEAKSKQMAAKLSTQSFKEWNLVYFVKEYSQQFKVIEQSPKITLVNASQYEGLNLQRAATKYCDPKSIALLWHQGDSFLQQNSLQLISKQLTDNEIFALFVNLQHNNKTIDAKFKDKQIRRIMNKPIVQAFNQIANHLRFFSVQYYRYIAHFDLRHSSGRYFDKEIPLLSMLEHAWNFNPCESGELYYQARRLGQLMEIPRRRIHLNLTIQTKHIKDLKFSQFQYFGKFRYYSLCYTLEFFLKKSSLPIEHLAVFNDGFQFEGLQAGKNMQKIIPKKLHQVWINGNGNIPKFKQTLMKKVKETHPDYEYYLWSEKDITRQKFPYTFEILQKILWFDRTNSAYSKMAMVADLMRVQILFHHGGFYFDSNYLIFKDHSLDLLRTYRFVSSAEFSQTQRIFRTNSMFGSSPGYKELFRNLNPRILSNRNFFSFNAAQQTGPGLFGLITLGKQEQDQWVFQMGMQQIYPTYFYDVDTVTNLYVDKCIAPQNTPQDLLLFTNKKAYFADCSQRYPYALGTDFYREGMSWGRRRW